jgi:hypothetical protein
MRLSALIMSVVILGLVLVASPGVALAQRPPVDPLPEPSSILIWAGVAAVVGLLGWRTRRDLQLLILHQC